MKIDLGAPSEYNVSGIKKRINKLKNIVPIPYGINLDIGTGVGAYYSELNKYSKVLYATDVDLSYLLEFRKKNISNKNKIFVSAAESLSLKNEIFDSVFTIEVLEHVESLEQTLKEIYRILKPGGFLYVTVPNKFFPLETHMVHFGKYFIKGKYVPFLSMINFIHQKIGTSRRFGKKEFKSIFAEYGFTTVDFDYMMPPFDYFYFGRKFLKSFSEKMEKSILKFFSMTLIVVLKKISFFRKKIFLKRKVNRILHNA